MLAGLFSPLAFLWLLYAALAQRAELALQRQELRANNQTQLEQRAEMARQADAMDANAANARAEADAKYQPIFVLHRFRVDEGNLRLDIRNDGAVALDVTGAPVPVRHLTSANAVHDEPVRGNLLPYWPTNRRAGFIGPGDTSNGTFDFTITVTRLDLRRKEYHLRLIVLESRVQVLQVNDLN